MATLSFLPFYLLFLLTLTYVAMTCFHNYRRLSDFRGPLLARISDLWLFTQSLKHQQQEAIMDVLEKNGPYARIGPNLLVTNDPDLLRHMSAPRSPWSRGGWYEVHKFDSTSRNIFSTRDEKKHARLRNKLGPAYSGKGVDNLESSIIDQINRMLAMLRRDYTSNDFRPVDMARLSQYFTLDVPSSIAFGRVFDLLSV